MKFTVFVESAARDEILKMFNSTEYWRKMTPERQQRVFNYIKQFRDTTNSKEALGWLIRIIRRALIMFSEDPTSLKKAKQLTAQGYLISRVQQDLNFFLHPQQAGQFLPVWTALKEEIKNRTDLVQIELPQQAGADTPVRYKMVPARDIIQQELNKIQYTNANGTDKPTNEVYDQLNGVKSSIADTKELPQGKIIANYNDQITWNLLDVGKCEVEGRLMKHCGNSAARHGDQILSLRELKGIARMPRLTFIYNNGNLGEMKGYANEKPADSFHPYIVDLLIKQPIPIKQLVGSGYRPEKNFTLNDLDQKSFLTVAEKRPDLIKAQLNSPDQYQRIDKAHLDMLQRSTANYIPTDE